MRTLPTVVSASWLTQRQLTLQASQRQRSMGEMMIMLMVEPLSLMVPPQTRSSDSRTTETILKVAERVKKLRPRGRDRRSVGARNCLHPYLPDTHSTPIDWSRTRHKKSLEWMSTSASMRARGRRNVADLLLGPCVRQTDLRHRR